MCVAGLHRKTQQGAENRRNSQKPGLLGQGHGERSHFYTLLCKWRRAGGGRDQDRRRWHTKDRLAGIRMSPLAKRFGKHFTKFHSRTEYERQNFAATFRLPYKLRGFYD